MSPSDSMLPCAGWRRLWANRLGNMAIEFALIAPLVMLLLAGTVETSRYLMLHLKVQHASVTVADLVTRDETISETGINDIFQVVEQILAPFPVGDDSKIYISAISKEEDEDAEVFWQRANGSLSQTSAIGDEGDTVATAPAGLTLRDNETILVVEMYYRFEPFYFGESIFSWSLFPVQTVSKITYFRPRIGSLEGVSS